MHKEQTLPENPILCFLLILGAISLFTFLFRPLALDAYDKTDSLFLTKEDLHASKGLPFRVTRPPAVKGRMMNRAELRWVFIQERRFDVVKSKLNHENTEEVKAFSLAVRDFNKRAADFRYENADYLAAKRDIKKYHISIEDDALYKYQALRSP